MEAVLRDKHTHAIYPGSSASNLSTLISLNLGWGAKFRVLLDSDKEGMEQRDRYKKLFGLPDEDFILLPGSKTKIEGMFTVEEKKALHAHAFSIENANVSKDEFLALMRALHAQRDEHAKAIGRLLSTETKERFETLLKSLKA